MVPKRMKQVQQEDTALSIIPFQNRDIKEGAITDSPVDALVHKFACIT